MIQKYVDIFMGNKQWLRDRLFFHPAEYLELVRMLVSLFNEVGGAGLDKANIHVIDNGDYQGVQLFLIPKDEYQPSEYLMTTVSYGSCSVCDTLQRIRDAGDDTVSEAQKDLYITLMLHLTQRLVEIKHEDMESDE